MSSFVPKQTKVAIKYNSRYVSEKVINEIPTQMPQAPNRKGNVSKMPPKEGSGRMATVGVTNVSTNTIKVSQPKGMQGAPKSSGNPFKAGSPKVCVDQPKKDYKPTNLGFIAKNTLKFGG